MDVVTIIILNILTKKLKNVFLQIFNIVIYSMIKESVFNVYRIIICQ
jgi:hypothetical protein